MPDSITKTTESGAFIRTTIRKGKRRKQKTIRIKPNQEKVVLGHLGDFEVYAYPYDFPDRVFIGSFPVSTQIEDYREVLSIGQRIRHYLDGDYLQNKRKKQKGAKVRTEAIVQAYNLGLKRRTEGQNGQENV